MIGYFNDSEKTQLLGIGAVYKSQDWNIYKRELTDDDLAKIGKWPKAVNKKKESEEIIPELVQEIYEALPKTSKDKIDSKKIDKVKSFIDSKESKLWVLIDTRYLDQTKTNSYI